MAGNLLNSGPYVQAVDLRIRRRTTPWLGGAGKRDLALKWIRKTNEQRRLGLLALLALMQLLVTPAAFSAPCKSSVGNSPLCCSEEVSCCCSNQTADADPEVSARTPSCLCFHEPTVPACSFEPPGLTHPSTQKTLPADRPAPSNLPATRRASLVHSANLRPFVGSPQLQVWRL
jgi:hypothetical protein